MYNNPLNVVPYSESHIYIAVRYVYISSGHRPHLLERVKSVDRDFSSLFFVESSRINVFIVAERLHDYLCISLMWRSLSGGPMQLPI
jgi:hypothetical protein